MSSSFLIDRWLIQRENTQSSIFFIIDNLPYLFNCSYFLMLTWKMQKKKKIYRCLFVLMSIHNQQSIGQLVCQDGLLKTREITTNMKYDNTLQIRKNAAQLLTRCFKILVMVVNCFLINKLFCHLLSRKFFGIVILCLKLFSLCIFWTAALDKLYNY